MTIQSATMQPLLKAAKMSKPLESAELTTSIGRLLNFKFPKKIGIAVSGGVDSMALAYVCNQFAKKNNIQAYAFTVDHKLRYGSAIEAQKIGHILREHTGLIHETIELNWRNTPKNTSTIETSARQLRYRALAEVCVNYKIEHLLLAHTQDDQLETLVMRMLRGSTMAGLSGMRRISWIPEGTEVFDAENIKILRPLLLEPKIRTISTCLNHNLPWIEDMTNHDPTYTKRNAVRYLLSQPKSLPEALQPQNLIFLSERLSERKQIAIERASRLYQREIRKGRIKLFRSTISLRWHFDPSTFEEIDMTVLISFLQRLVSDIVPRDMVDIQAKRYKEIIPKIFTPKNAKFTFMGLVWSLKPIKQASSKRTTEDREYYWYLSREPANHLSSHLTMIALPPDTSWSMWCLWDGRIWIRCRLKSFNNSGHFPRYLGVRAFLDEDYEIIRKLSSIEQENFTKCASKLNRKILSTIPAIYDPEISRLVALPTLGYSINHPSSSIDFQFRLRDRKILFDYQR
ncbi:PP-loop family-domain-containing protein [Dipodascopsis uninucleata]